MAKIQKVYALEENGECSSLRALINKMIIPTEIFEKLEINNDSEIGKYINNVTMIMLAL